MDNWKYALIASVVTIVGMALIALLSRFKLWKVSVSIFLISGVFFYILVLVGRRSDNRGFDDGPWGAHGLLRELINLEIILVSLGVGAFVTLLFLFSIIFSNNKK
ncbi:hypothetical protein [Acinetobacter haemolyticus]|uniref:Uncharacterized protein n=1 Tax=Acinetobacter haemolyticus ATCC 19194 TaxID=707232 RepID=D4XQM1_ACIHA|nr:hypothetical protein [Acinetobacter haemolyticus]EFF82507.1 hypothetical protein HMP0015_2013 [Acinetobacter haemolyticus ATCC 19194]WHR57918.1 hypothetical protein PGW89_00230 [Acinetobacter haemolyticus]